MIEKIEGESLTPTAGEVEGRTSAAPDDARPRAETVPPDTGTAAGRRGRLGRKRGGRDAGEDVAQGASVAEVAAEEAAAPAVSAPPSEPPQENEAAASEPPSEESEGEAAASLIPLDPSELRGALEAILFSVAEPLPIRTLSELLGASVHEVRAAVEDLRMEYIDGARAFRLEDIAGGVQILTLSRFDPWIRRLRDKERDSRLSAASLESLAVIAYKQPISKADLEAIRGVGCGPTLKTLLEKGLIQIAGRGEGLGKPLLYGTTRRFLESFGISSVRELPQPEILEHPASGGGARPTPPQAPTIDRSLGEGASEVEAPAALDAAALVSPEEKSTGANEAAEVALSEESLEVEATVTSESEDAAPSVEATGDEVDAEVQDERAPHPRGRGRKRGRLTGEHDESLTDASGPLS
jgi:segregation and condensation protein B